MLRLTISHDPEWLDLGHGVRVLVRPFNSALMLQARAEMRRMTAEDDSPQPPTNEEALLLLTRAAARHAITEWSGVGDEAGKPIEVTRAGIDALMDIYQMCDAFRDRYVTPRLVLESEKNGSSPAPDGTSAGAQTTADGAKAPVPSARTH